MVQQEMGSFFFICWCRCHQHGAKGQAPGLSLSLSSIFAAVALPASEIKPHVGRYSDGLLTAGYPVAGIS